MFGTIRKHQTWLWVIIIAVIIVSFVIFFSPYTRMDSGRGQVRLGSISGDPITEEEFIHAQRDVTLQYFFMSGGRWPDQDARQMGFDIERETYQWLLLQQKAEDFDIHISSETVAQLARDMTGQFQRAGVSTPQAFIQQVLQPHGLTATDFERFLRRYLAVQQLMAVVGVSGKLVPPADLNSFYARERQEIKSQAVFFPTSEFAAQVSVTPEAISNFYSNRLATYRIPERVQVQYVAFPISNYLAKAEAELTKTNFNEMVDAAMTRLGTNYTQFGSTPEAAKTKVREEMIRNRALPDVRREAAEFASAVFDMEPASPDNLKVVAEKRGLTVQETQPFDRRTGPPGMNVPQVFVTDAFALDATNTPFAGPVVGEDSVYVMAFGRRVPSEVPALDQVRAKVEQDYRLEQASSLAYNAALSAEHAITNAMAQGKDFAAAAAEAKVKPTPLPAFSLSARSLPEIEGRIALNDLKQVAFGTEPGKLSPVQRTADGAMLLYVEAKLPIDETKRATEMPNFARYIRQSRQNEAFNQWFGKEASQGLRDTPLGQPRPTPNMGSGGAAQPPQASR